MSTEALTEHAAACAARRATVPVGPWQTEPDRVEFEHAGFPCLMVRNSLGFHWCGYVGVPPGHALHGMPYDKLWDDEDPSTKGANDFVEVHGGLTYGEACAGAICHVPKPGEPDDVWWLGFDCAHCHDYAPGMGEFRHFGAIYRDCAYVEAQVRRLAEQIAEAAQ